jgi:hypothetical protein
LETTSTAGQRVLSLSGMLGFGFLYLLAGAVHCKVFATYSAGDMWWRLCAITTADVQINNTMATEKCDWGNIA